MARGGDREEKTSSQADYESLAKTADRMGLKGRDRTKYIHDHMTRFGYKPVTSYVDPEDGDDDDSSFFGRSSRRRRNRDDDDDDYPF